MRFLALALAVVSATASAHAAGVTIITHGFNGNVTDWVIPMANAVAQHPRLPGTDSSCYRIYFTNNGQGQIVAAHERIGATAPLDADSGEIFIKLDWASFSGGGDSTTEIAEWAVPALLATNFIPELGGRALAELPLHFAGHSRGSSVVSEMSRLLGAQGVWVDHMTFLDPRPVGLFGDANVRAYANVLFADNYWQNLGDGLFVPNGQAIAGAYNRQLTNLNGGYSSSHSDTHLWYHGTIDLATPASDTQTNITASERAAWWTGPEAAGASNGFFLSLIGGGDRTSTNEPAGAGRGRIRDGFNQLWDLGAGIGANRTALPANNGAWPNLLRCDLLGTNAPSVDDPFAVRVHFQFGQVASLNTELALFLDADANPFNGGTVMVAQTLVTGTGLSAVGTNLFNVALGPAVIAPGAYRIAARISANGRSRWLHAGPPLTLGPSRQAVRLTPLAYTNGVTQLRVDGFPGQNVVVESSTNLTAWSALRTNVLPSGPWLLSDTNAAALPWRFYRGRLLP